jgi:hypothetical protein
MKIIHPQNEFITKEKHLERLNILKKCMLNSINNKYVISKSLFKRKADLRYGNTYLKKENLVVLETINNSILFYS